MLTCVLAGIVTDVLATVGKFGRLYQRGDEAMMSLSRFFSEPAVLRRQVCSAVLTGFSELAKADRAVLKALPLRLPLFLESLP